MLLLWLAAGCGSSADSGAAGAPNLPTTSIPNGAQAATTAKSIAFTETSLTFVPSTAETVGVQVTPAGVYDVRFALIGDARDAYLDHGDVKTAADGTASVELTAPSSAATFTLRASVDQLNADLPASSGTSFGSLQVIPDYDGQRPVTAWIATAQTGSTCPASGDVPPPDGQLTATAAANADPVVLGVPAGSPVTVTLRAGHFAGGCAELPSVIADKENTITIPVIDRPLQMTGVSLPLRLGMTTSPALSSAWSSLAGQIASAFAGAEPNDATALLDAMYDSAPTAAKSPFGQARSAYQWDAVLGAALTAKYGPNGVRGLVSQWVESALPALSKTLIDGTLSSVGTVSGSATIRVNSVGGADPGTSGFSTSINVSWTPEPDDQVIFGGSASVAPGRLATALALGPAKAASASAKTVAGALSNLVCPNVATALVGASGTDVAYFECDTPCIVSRCSDALSEMWARAAPNSALSQTLSIAASGTAGVDDSAAPATIDGTWVGSVVLTELPLRVSGPAVGGTSGPQ